MLACYLDMGNSRVKAWLCLDGIVQQRYSFAHPLQPDELFAELPAAFRVRVDFVGISSVMDANTNQYLAVIAEQIWGCVPRFAVSTATTLGVNNAYTEPGQLGVDRWLNVLAVAGGEPSCVVSCGTALVIDAVAGVQHLGGFIVPGLHLQLSSLVQGTRKVRPQWVAVPDLAWGKNTSDAVHRGIVLGAVAAITQAYEQLTEQTQSLPRLVLTGGDAEKLSPHLRVPHAIIPELLLCGLQRYFGHPVATE